MATTPPPVVVPENLAEVPQPDFPPIRSLQVGRNQVRFFNRGKPVGSLDEIIGLGPDGEPVSPSVCVFRGNKYLPETRIYGEDNHMTPYLMYLNDLKAAIIQDGTSLTDAGALALATAKKCAFMDLVVRPHRGESTVCIRSPSLRSDQSGPEVVAGVFNTMDLLKSVGLPEERLRVLDNSPETIAAVLERSMMHKLFQLPRSPLERVQFIEDSRMSLRKGSGKEYDPLSDMKIYYGMDGTRHLFASDFGECVESMIHRGLTRGNVSKALEHIAKLNTSNNNLLVRHLAFFGAKGFGSKQIQAASRALGEKSPDAPLDETDQADLRALSKAFSDSVSNENLQSYSMENDVCRETIFRSLIGDFGQYVPIPNRDYLFIPPGEWVPGPIITDEGIAFNEGASKTVRDMTSKLYLQHRIRGGGSDIEWMAVYKSHQSGSPRTNTPPGREVYLVLMKDKKSLHPEILQVRTSSINSPDEVENLSSTITAMRLLSGGIPMPEYNLAEDEGKCHLSRRYLTDGRPSHRLPLEYYCNETFYLNLASLMGQQAGINACLGRDELFDDGGEVVRMSLARGEDDGAPLSPLSIKEGTTPQSIILTEPDGLFSNTKKPIIDSLDVYSKHLAMTMLKMHVMGVGEREVDAVNELFADNFALAVGHRKTDIRQHAERYRSESLSEANPKLGERFGLLVERIGAADTQEIKSRLKSDSEQLFHRMCAVVDGVDDQRQKKAVLNSLDLLFQAHPLKASQALEKFENDESFQTLTATEKNCRINVLRIDMAVNARQPPIKLKSLYDYIQGLKAQEDDHSTRAYLRFKEEIHEARGFEGLNLHGTDAKQIDRVYDSRNSELLAELVRKGYVTDSHPVLVA